MPSMIGCVNHKAIAVNAYVQVIVSNPTFTFTNEGNLNPAHARKAEDLDLVSAK